MMAWGRLFQMWGPKCEKMRKLWALRLKRWNLSMRVSDEDTNIRKGRKEIGGNGQSIKRVILLFTAFV